MYIDEAYIATRFGITPSGGFGPDEHDSLTAETNSDAPDAPRRISENVTRVSGSAYRLSAEQESAYLQAHKKLERLLSVRERSACELRKRLIKEGYDACVVEALLEQAVETGLVSDERFADVLIRSRLSAGRGVPGIARELRSHDIDPDALPGFPDAWICDSSTQVEAAVRLLNQKPPRAKNKLNAAYGKLMRSGYSSSVASQAAHRWFESL